MVTRRHPGVSDENGRRAVRGHPRPQSLGRVLVLSAVAMVTSAVLGQAQSAVPVITEHPASRVVVVGQTWTLRVTVADSSGVSFQWRRNGIAIPGATGSSYAFHAAQLPPAGPGGDVFDVVIRNAAGSVVSNPATIRVVTAEGPWKGGLWIAAGPDGVTWSAPQPFIGPAGVPSLARTSAGRLVATFQWFPFDTPEAFDRVAVSFSDDGGTTWTVPVAIHVEGLPAAYMRPFDPTIVALDDGRLRLYFTSNTGPGSVNAFYSAISTDGITYDWETGVRFSPGRGTVDCAVAHWNGLWHLTSPIGAPHEGAYHAVSSDGLQFTRQADIPSSGSFNWLGNLISVDGALRFYGNSPAGLWYAESRDGLSWTSPVVMNVRGGDPAVVTDQGLWLLVFVGPGF